MAELEPEIISAAVPSGSLVPKGGHVASVIRRLQPRFWATPRSYRISGILMGLLLAGLSAGAALWANDRFRTTPGAHDDELFNRAGLFLIQTIALIIALAGLGVIAVTMSLQGKKRAMTMMVIGIAGMIFCVVLRHLVVNFFLPYFVFRRVAVFVPLALIWILNHHEVQPRQSRKIGLLRAMAGGMLVAAALLGAILRVEGLMSTWITPHLFAATYRGLIGLRILLASGLIADLAIAGIGGFVMADEWFGGPAILRRITHGCFGLVVAAILVGIASQTLLFSHRQMDDLLTRWVFVIFWLLMTLGGLEMADVWLGVPGDFCTSEKFTGTEQHG